MLLPLCCVFDVVVAVIVVVVVVVVVVVDCVVALVVVSVVVPQQQQVITIFAIFAVDRQQLIKTVVVDESCYLFLFEKAFSSLLVNNC